MSDRLTELEVKIAFLERHVTAQDKAMLELHEELERLRKEIAGLRLRANAPTSADDGAHTEERPPHY